MFPRSEGHHVAKRCSSEEVEVRGSPGPASPREGFVLRSMFPRQKDTLINNSIRGGFPGLADSLWSWIELVHERCRISRVSLPPAPSMTAKLLRKSMSASTHPKYVTNVVLDHGEHVGSSLNEHVVSDDGHPSPHHELPTLSDNLLRVPVNKHPVRPLLTRSRHHSAIPSARISQESIISQNSVRSSHQIYLDAPHINVSSPNCLPTSSFISLYHPAVSFYSLENNFSFASIDPSFYSAQESLDLDCHSHQPVVSIKDFLSAASHHQQSPLPTENISAEPGHDEPQLCNGSQGTESSKDPKSSSLEDSADESFQCRGLSSSQITPDSRYQLSDQTPSQFPSDQDNSQPSSEQRGYHSTDKKT
ncbi:hypothetical protein PCASD_25545 [Puccinia coronata f. sp. avenae]|uniref:Uncharacterized protein n=1 Tax=Puccinia coronata f. sp. avenae TaxID=200324 RepID=A0A2N5TJ24_9BASI|nr:hypothetical protein PCASD_25545 [Puccinia coronata f. sp. avenae]